MSGVNTDDLSRISRQIARQLMSSVADADGDAADVLIITERIVIAALLNATQGNSLNAAIAFDDVISPRIIEGLANFGNYDAQKDAPKADK